jgi:hypothetical protein
VHPEIPPTIAPRGHAQIKALAQALGMPIKDVIALSTGRDPFLSGQPAQVTKAQWFLGLWQRFGYDSGIHTRRIHYQLVVQPEGQRRRHDGTTYDNTEQCWALLQDASLAARYLGLVDPLAFDDHRNPPPVLPVGWGEVPEPPSLEWLFSFLGWRLPTIATALADGIDLALPEPEVRGYDYRRLDQAYHLELWIEKSTMDDVLEPLAEAYGAVFMPGAGFQSVTNAVKLVARRAQESGKPVRIFYLSDFDPAGDKMPAAIARQIEFWLPLYAPDADIKLTPLGLTREQVVAYALPTIPNKDSDTRKANFEKKHGEGAVELDALEALYPGELARIVRAALDPYMDAELEERLLDAGAAAQDQMTAAWEAHTAEIRARLETIETEARQVYARYEQVLARLARRLERELAPARDALAAVASDLADAQDTFAPDVPERPQSEAQPEEDAWLFESQRTYLEQLRLYKTWSPDMPDEDPD